MADEASINGDVETLNRLLSEGYRIFPGNPIVCHVVRKGRDDKSAANVLRFFLDKRWKEGCNAIYRRSDVTQQEERGQNMDQGQSKDDVVANGNIGETASGETNLLQILAQVRDEDNYTALHWAARNNFSECAQLLLEKGKVDIEVRGTRTAVTALHLAANFGYS